MIDPVNVDFARWSETETNKEHRQEVRDALTSMAQAILAWVDDQPFGIALDRVSVIIGEMTDIIQGERDER